MYYPEEIVEEVREKNDIVSVISQYVSLKKSGSNYVGLCPFHNEKSPSFSVSQDKQMFYCFGCGEGGNVFTFLMKYENISFVEALKDLAQRAGVTLPEGPTTMVDRSEARMRDRLLEINREAARYFHFLLKQEEGKHAYDYLKGRGLSEETITHFGLGYAGKGGLGLYKYLKSKGYQDNELKESGLFSYTDRGVTDKFWNRVMFPIMDVNNHVIAFGGRVMGDGKPKYLNSQETKIFEKSRVLYGLNYARRARTDSLIICEGYMDVISLHQAGFNNAVAALGTSFTSGHGSLMKRYAHTVYVCFDSDGAGVKAALRAIPILRSSGLNLKVINLNPHKDPDEFLKNLGQEEFQKRMDEAENHFLYTIRQLKTNYDITDPAAKTNFETEVANRLVSDFQDELERSNYIEAVSREFMIPIDLLKSSVKQKALYYVKQPDRRSGPVEEEERPLRKGKKKLEDGVVASERIILTWMIEDPLIYKKTRDYLLPEYFTSPLMQKVARLLYEQLEDGNVNPARIISAFELEEEQNEVAGLFHKPLEGELDLKQRERALNDTVKKICMKHIETVTTNSTDLSEISKVINKRKEIEGLHISLN